MDARPPTADPSARRAAVVTGAWAVMAAAAVGFVLANGVNFPFLDEWAALPILAAPRPDPGWLWERHNEHLLPLPRLVYWAAFRLTGDLRAGMLLSAAAWAVLAKLLIDAARAVRGRPAYADVVFPVVLLNWSQYENLLMSYQVGFACSSVLAGLTLRELALGTATTGRILRVGLYAALLPMCGGHGLVLAGPGVVWLAAVGIAARRPALCGALVLIASLSASQYAWASPPAPPTAWQPPLTGKTIAVGLLGFGSVGYGLAAWHLWPWLGVVPTAVAVLAGWSVGRAWLGRRPADLLSLFGLTAFALGTLALAAVIAYGRGRYGAFAAAFPRYTVLSALLPTGFVFLWLKHGGPRLARWGPAGLAAVAIALLPLNTRLGWEDGRRHADVQRAAEKDLRAGVPVEVVAERANFLVFNNPAAWAAAVEDYAGRDLGRLTRVSHLPPVETTPVPPAGVTARPDGWFAVTFPRPREVLAVRVRVRYANRDPHRPARFRVAWHAGGKERVRDDWLFRPPTNEFGDPSLVVWIDGPLAAFRFLPDADAPGGAEVAAVEVLGWPPGSGDLRSTASTGTRPAR